MSNSNWFRTVFAPTGLNSKQRWAGPLGAGVGAIIGNEIGMHAFSAEIAQLICDALGAMVGYFAGIWLTRR